MFYESLIAIAMLNGTLPDGELLLEIPTVRIAVLALAVDAEVLDPREVRGTFFRPESVQGDLEALQKRYQDLRGAPPAIDAVRFPDRPLVNELLVFNRAYQRHAEMSYAFHGPPPDLAERLREIEDLYHVWDNVRDARCDYYYVWVRRYALKRLRDLLGEEAYYHGELPPVVPLWRFMELRSVSQ